MFKIEDIPLFCHIDKKYHKELYDNIYIRHFEKSSILFYEGDCSDYLHILLEGQVSLYKTSPKNTTIQVHRLNAPSVIGEYAILEQVAFPATCEFVSPKGVVGLLHFSKLMEYMKDLNFSLALLKSMSNKVMLLSSLVHKETIFSSEAKVADLILNDINTFSRVKKNEIASILNITPETLSRILTKFKQKGIITLLNHKLNIKNREALYVIFEKNTLKACVDCLGKKK